MALDTRDFTTGPATLPDAGAIVYNGCNFSPLFVSSVSGNVVKDNAARTTKLMEYLISVDGYATLPEGASTINDVMRELRDRLTVHAAALIYRGRGMDLVINPEGGGGTRDVAWGPVPRLLEFEPLGGGRSARVRWQVEVRVPEIKAVAGDISLRKRAGLAAVPLLQFNYDTSVTYGEDGYSGWAMRGTLEVPMTRTPGQATRTLTFTADNARNLIESRLLAELDLSRFRVVRRQFDVSRDKRTLEWDFAVEEKAYMDLPVEATIARGNYSVRPAKAGMGLCLWLCTLRGTYVIRHDRPRRHAWLAFLTLMRLRMAESRHGHIPKIPADEQNPKRRLIKRLAIFGPILGVGLELWEKFLKEQEKIVKEGRKAFLIDFSFDEGMYLDSKTITFSATWRLTTTFSHILLASGIWKKLPEDDPNGFNLWASSVRDISGSNSWMINRVDPALDVIVDFGGGQ